MKLDPAQLLKRLAGAWFETFIVFEIVLHWRDLIKPDIMAQAAVGALLTIFLRWINPKDSFPHKGETNEQLN